MPTNLTEYTVSEISGALKRTVEDTFGLIKVRGEISGFKRAASGHAYFSLKDAQSRLDAVGWRGSVQRWRFPPEDGLEVIATGRLTTYPGRSTYQMVVEQMEPAGAGALMAMLEERRKRLTAEGLFDAARKRPLPFLPQVIGVVTSPTGAVIRDILHRLADRFPRRVLLWPVLVQGEQAAEQIAAAIHGFGAMPESGPVRRPDLLIVARGGGSIEDLMAFNEESVVRAIAASPIPVISAVGHETDSALSDFVADVRAPTPTAAAEMAVPVRMELIDRLAILDGRLRSASVAQLTRRRTELERSARGLPDPRMLLNLATQRLDDLSERLRLRQPQDVLRGKSERLEMLNRRLRELVGSFLKVEQRHLDRTSARLVPSHILALLARATPVVADRERRLQRAMVRRLDDGHRRLETLAKLLESLGYRQVLERGYALVRAPATGELVTDAEAARKEAKLNLIFHDGEVTVTTGSRTKRAASDEPVQESLL
ncbi:MAG TPA: exodeoxyribonuclease VII large subunit [Geminicoccus sp.]|jgi:exodeoxyribonuclease VII large subunit|uniref:exodeoxyribonuclease VII large subunit n=1 Tax=Geminicoccus sp. TaxID=2024832 RepID=UPI002E33E711|nr:exodeoxyribonuclease VII large subunit [Geminicoccus sp.]HEX2527803.1 exodeoxyribonuclease VII large subunit [Geminicoccus sp.]